MGRHSDALTMYVDPAHRVHYDPDAGVVTFTAHGAGDDVMPVEGPVDRKRLAALVQGHDFRCCEWPTLLHYRLP